MADLPDGRQSGPATPGEAAAPAAQAARGGGWVLLPLAWCAWLLVWLIPSFLLGPRVAIVSAWLEAETAPAALVAAAVFFLVAIWPFWPALVRSEDGRTPAAWWFRSALELAILLALAVPFARVAWSVGGRAFDAGPLAAASAGVAAMAMGLRVAAARWPAAGRWIMALAMLACAAPVVLHYAAAEAMGAALPRVLEVSPMVGLARLALEGWPADPWRTAADVWLWPAAGIAVAAVALLATRGRRAGPDVR